MITFPNAKINLGLNILERREDGFHNLESVMIPIPLRDSLEIVIDTKSDPGKCDFKVLGLEVEGAVTENLCYKAYCIMAERYDLPAVKIRLLKSIPMGAGLGGGSSDAAFTIKVLNRLFELNLSDETMQSISDELGSDCSFFIANKVALVSGRGEILQPFDLNLDGYYIVVVHPDIHINTTGAYAAIIPDPAKKGQLSKELTRPIEQWTDNIVNDFELNALAENPELSVIKDRLYTQGALYAAMTGSGSSLYGIFASAQILDPIFPDCKVWSDRLG